MHDVGQYRSGIRILCEDKAGPQTVSSKRHNNTSRVCTIFARSCRLLPPNGEVGTGPMEHVVGMSIGPNEGHARRPLELDERWALPDLLWSIKVCESMLSARKHQKL